MNETEHNELMVYLDELVRIASKVRYGYDWFMQSPYMKLCSETLSELLVIDAERSGI